MTSNDAAFPTRRDVIGAAAAVGVAAVAGSADALPGRRRDGERPAVILVHGAFVDGSCWTDVIARLQKRSYVVAAVQNPLTSLSDDVAATQHMLERYPGPVVLVGHSWGGMVITQAGAVPNVKALVYVSALAPDAGESAKDLQRLGPASSGMEAAVPDAHGVLWFDPARYRAGLASDLAPDRVAVMAATQQPIASGCFSERASAAAWRSRPSYYLLSTSDQALSPVMQRKMALRMRAHTQSVASSHMSLISHADVVVALIEMAAAT